jgi:hypothetical protein
MGERARMMKKNDRRIQPLQEELIEVKRQVRGTQQGQAFNQVVTAQARFYMFQSLRIVRYDHGGEQLIADHDTGEAVFRRIVKAASQHENEARVFLVCLKRKKMTDVDRSDERGGHAIGIELSDLGLGMHFFDSNVGEFLFGPASLSDGDDFLHNWWKLFCMMKEGEVRTQKYAQWRLDGVIR